MIGTVKFFNTEKGYGFLTPEDGSADVFLHIKDLQKSGIKEVTQGQKIGFDVLPSRNGKTCAQNVRYV